MARGCLPRFLDAGNAEVAAMARRCLPLLLDAYDAELAAMARGHLPLPACGERVGVRGARIGGIRIAVHRHGREYAPSVCVCPSASASRSVCQRRSATNAAGARAQASIAARQVRVTCAT